MKKIILLIAIMFYGTLSYSVVVHGAANYKKYNDNNDRLRRIKEGCSNPQKRNYAKCIALQRDLVSDIGAMNCGKVVDNIKGINGEAVKLCQKAIDKYKPGGSSSSPASPESGGGGSTPSPSGGTGTTTAPSPGSTGSGGSGSSEGRGSTYDGGDRTSVNNFGNAGEVDLTKDDAEKSGIETKDENSIVAGILNAVYSVVGMISVLVIVICGIMIITADGDSQRVATARRGIIYALVGLLIVVSAFIITGVIQNLGGLE